MRKIEGKKWYKPREIAVLGLIKNSTGGDNVESNYNFILKLIKAGKLAAKNYGIGGTPYWMVSEDEIKRWNGEVA